MNKIRRSIYFADADFITEQPLDFNLYTLHSEFISKGILAIGNQGNPFCTF